MQNLYVKFGLQNDLVQTAPSFYRSKIDLFSVRSVDIFLETPLIMIEKNVWLEWLSLSLNLLKS